MAVVAERRPGTVLTPGLDEEHRAVAWELMARGTYVSAWRLGYAAAALLFLAGAVATVVLVALAALAIRNRDIDLPSSSLAGMSPYAAAGLVATVTLVVAVVVHGAFLAMTAMDTPSLGSGHPGFGPIRSAVWWIESLLWALRGGLAFVGPPFLFVVALMMGGVLFGMIGGVVWFMCALWLLGDPITNLAKPGRLLRDLHERLATPGDSDSRVVTYWMWAWGTARGVDFAAAASIYVLAVILGLFALIGPRFGFHLDPAPPEQQATASWMLGGLIVAIQVIADVISLFLLAVITFDLSDRQRRREKWVMSGLRTPSGHPAPTGARPTSLPPAPISGLGSTPTLPPAPISGFGPAFPAAVAAQPGLTAAQARPVPGSAPPSARGPAALSGPAAPAEPPDSIAAESGPGMAAGVTRPHSWPGPLLPQSQPRWIRTQQVAMAQPAGRPAKPASPGSSVESSAQADAPAPATDEAKSAGSDSPATQPVPTPLDRVRDWPEGI
jgi:hypothetical protein